MDLIRFVVKAVVLEGLSLHEVAAAHGVSRSWVCECLARYRADGEQGLHPRSRRPHSSPARLAADIEDEIVALRKDLAGRGLDAGPLVANDVLPADLATCNRQLAETALRPWTPVFIHGDLQVDHVFVDGDKVTGVVDWSEASQGDALLDVAILTLGHKEHLGDVVAGYGTDVDRDLISAWWALRCLTNVRWLAEHGYGSPEEFPEVAVLRSRP